LIDIASIGECMVEFYSEPRLGANVYIQGFGGDTLNTIFAASRLGISVAYLTKVGDDEFSQFLLKSWKEENIDISFVKKVKGSFVGIYFINLDENGERSFVYYRKGSAASTLQPEDFDISLLRKSTILYSSGITQALSASNHQTVKYLFQEFKKNSANNNKIAYDPNFREKLWVNRTLDAVKTQAEVLPYIDIILPSFPSDAFLSESKTPEEMIGYYTDKNVNMVIVKLSGDGCLYTEDNGETIHHLPPLKVSEIVDTTGAGDAFNGGVLAGIIKGYSKRKAIKLGTIVAGLKIQAKGALASLPTLEDIKKNWTDQ